MPFPSQVLFLPGASGNTLFWEPLANRLAYPASHIFIEYPGFGSTPTDPKITGLDDLVTRVVRTIDQPTALVAQSMGGVIAILATLERPNLVTHLVLTVTSGGIDTKSLGAEDWRTEYAREYPHVPDWFVSCDHNLTAKLGDIAVPTLLLWGDADPISPVSVGQRLAKLLPNAQLHVTAGGNHDLATVYARQLAPLIDAHLTRGDQ